MLREWWKLRSTREQLILGSAFLLLFSLALYLLFWEPLQRETARLRQSVDQQMADLAWMRSAAVEAKMLSGQQVRTAKPSTGADTPSLLTLVDQTAKLARLGDALKRLEPQGQNQLRVQMENVGFDPLLLWLSSLQNKHGLSLVDATVNRQAASGRVNARLVLER